MSKVLGFLSLKRYGTVCGSWAGDRQREDSCHKNSIFAGEEVGYRRQYFKLVFLPRADFCFTVRLKEEDRICVSTDGPWENVVKFKPPMCFSMDDAELVASCIDRILTGQFLVLPVERWSKRQNHMLKLVLFLDMEQNGPELEKDNI